jgi:hypothetical protein
MNTHVALEDLTNFGLLQTQEIKSTDTATVLVIGLPRSGTSMVAAVLKALGVFIGEQVDNAVFEDRELAALLGSGDTGRLTQFIAQRNAAHSVWGFKRPEAYRQLEQLCRVCRNPRVIVTFRDVLAIALRNNISMQIDPIQSLPRIADEYRVLSATISRLSVPCLLVSYEKALQYPLEMVGKIAAFCGLEASEAQIKQAAEVVENGSATYVRAARLEYHGFVGKLVNGQLRGWVKATTRDDIRVAVELQIDGEVVQKARADIYRPDVEQAGFGDGRYGFAFKIDDNVSRQSVVAVRIQNSPILVKNSGLPLSSY